VPVARSPPIHMAGHRSAPRIAIGAANVAEAGAGGPGPCTGTGTCGSGIRDSPTLASGAPIPFYGGRALHRKAGAGAATLTKPIIGRPSSVGVGPHAAIGWRQWMRHPSQDAHGKDLYVGVTSPSRPGANAAAGAAAAAAVGAPQPPDAWRPPAAAPAHRSAPSLHRGRPIWERSLMGSPAQMPTGQMPSAVIVHGKPRAGDVIGPRSGHVIGPTSRPRASAALEPQLGPSSQQMAAGANLGGAQLAPPPFVERLTAPSPR